MAVVSISRIQVRRGRKNSGTGLPQLASGEFGWAIDTQELYIGNGSVSEGAPAVGNTKILTDKDNIFDFAQAYEYRVSDEHVITGGISRTLQDRLDDRVSVRAFGATGDSSDQTTQLQLALDQIFLNDFTKNDPQSRYILHIEPGIYEISSTVYVPPYTTLIGAGAEKTIIRMTGAGPAFKTVDNNSTPGNPSDGSTTEIQTQPTNILIKGLTVEVPLNGIAFELNNCKESVFEDIDIKGSWTSGTDSSDTAFLLSGLSEAVMTRDNHFLRIRTTEIAYSVVSDFDIRNNIWNHCHFESNKISFLFGQNTVVGALGQQTGPKNNTVRNSVFLDIDKQALLITNGISNQSVSNRYYSVGNDGGSNITPVHAIIEYSNSTNASIDDWFDRSRDLSISPDINYIPEIKGNLITQSQYTNFIALGQLSTYTRMFKLPVDTYKNYEIEYLFKSKNYDIKRQGIFTVTVDPESNQRLASDEYDYIGDHALQENFGLEAEIYVDGLGILVLNSNENDDAEFYYRVKTKS